MPRQANSAIDPADLPKHIGLIMDGNGRWAKKRGLPRSAGHKAGAKTFTNICRYCNSIGIGYLTVYAFSTENWKRPAEEVSGIMRLLKQYLKDAKNYRKENIRTRFIGDLSVLDEEMLRLIHEAEEASKDATGLTLNIAVNYGGRGEILQAAKAVAEEVKTGKRDVSEIDEAYFAGKLYTAGQPEVDLIIRPSGECRLSNFLVWQCAYSEFIFMDTLWPDFKPADLDQALTEFAHRNRRFGGI